MLSSLRSFLGYGNEDGSSLSDKALSRNELIGRTYFELFEDHPVDWDAVYSRLEICPSEASIPAYNSGLSPLCAAIERDAPPTVIRLLLTLNPSSTSDVQGHTRLTPLFRAVARTRANQGSEVARLVLDAHPAAARLPIFSGDLPLHAARDAETAKVLLGAFPAAVGKKNRLGCLPIYRATYAGDSNAEVVKTLIEAGVAQRLGGFHGGGGVFVENEKGESPLTVIFDTVANGPDANEFRSVSDLLLLSPSAKNTWDKLGAIVVAASLAKARMKNVTAEKFNFKVLNSVIELGAPDQVVHCALNTNHQECMEFNELGQSTLCIAAMRKETPTSIIKMLLEQENGGNIAACKMDNFGRLPLHYAVASGRLYDDAMRAIIKAAPQALEIRDGITHLYPFMMAGLEKHCDIDLIYRLVTEAPGLLQPLSTGLSQPHAAKLDKKEQRISMKRLFSYVEAAPMWILYPLAPVAINMIACFLVQKFKVKLR